MNSGTLGDEIPNVPGRLQFGDPLIHVKALDFIGDKSWKQMASTAFTDWTELIEKTLPGLEGTIFLSDYTCSWLLHQTFLPSLSPGENRELPIPVEDLQRMVRDWVNGKASRPVGIELFVIEAADESPALLLGTALKQGNDDHKAALRGLFSCYLPFLYYHAEKKTRAQVTEQFQLSEKEADKKDELFAMVQKLYSKIDTDDVLNEIFKRIHEFYPEAAIDLYLSQDNRSSSLPVKPLNFTKVHEDVCTRAFLEGQIIVNKESVDGVHELAAPILGKQGVYGVMHLHSHQGSFQPSDVQLMTILSAAAGSAFENAKLYEQSNLLVSELKLINDLTKRLSQSLKVTDIFNFACIELQRIFRADTCCILQLDQEKKEFLVKASNLPALLDESFPMNYGYSGITYMKQEPVIVSDYRDNPSVASKVMEITGSRSLIAAPVMMQGSIEGSILIAHSVPGYFTYDNYKLLQVLSGHIGIALANASLHAEVRRMAITDHLTGLYARHYLDEQISMMQKKDFCGSLIVVDIDNFKQINDTFGHQIGDKILIQVSRVIRSSIRDGDIPARWGGEELAIYLPQVTSDQAIRIAERVRGRVEMDTDPQVSVSCGVSQWDWQDEKISVESLFYRSDMALYKAKREGKNRIKTG